MATFGPVIETPEEEQDYDEIEVEFDEDEDEQDGLEVLFGDVLEDAPEDKHGANLAETLDQAKVEEAADKAVEFYEADKSTRSEWATAYVKGLELLGLKIEDRSQPWQGASGVFHPILTETIIRFQAQAMGEMFPASGPARTKIVGKEDKEVREKSERIEREMNYQLTEEMVEYRDETEQALFHLPMAGSAFKKVYYDPVAERPAAMFVPAEDMVVSYGATSLEKAERFTHVMKKSSDELEELMDVGFYREVELSSPVDNPSDIQEKYDELAGEEKSYSSNDDRHTIIECHCNLRIEDEEGLARPYIVTVDVGSGKCLAIRRNWKKNDKRMRRRMHFVHYKYLPGLGFYGIGLIHLLGGLTKTATSILRQLIDSGTLANLPAGLKSRGLRIKGDNTPFRPGEFRDVDVPGDDIKKHISFLPYKEPSTVLFQLLGSVVDEARRIGAVAETELTQMKEEMPVGTAFAILERQMKVLSGVQARMHAALKKELQQIATIIADHMDDDYAWDDEGIFSRQEDFNTRIQIIPVSDPNAATTAQKVVSYQAAMQMSQQAPQLYNMGKLHRQMLEVLDVDNADEILKLPEDIEPMDPVTENMAVLNQEPIKAFMYQDHEAHIAVHMAAMEDPKIQQMVGQSPFASAIQNSMAAHITEHVAMQYRRQIEEQLGVPLPPEDEKLPEDAEREVSRMAAQAAQKLLGKHQQEAAAEEAQKQAQDPLTQLQQREMALKEKEFQHESQLDMLKFELDAFQKGANIGEMRERLNSEEVRAAANIAVKMMTEPRKDEKLAIDAAKIATEQLKKLQESGRID